jgi:hypothetical protein
MLSGFATLAAATELPSSAGEHATPLRLLSLLQRRGRVISLLSSHASVNFAADNSTFEGADGDADAALLAGDRIGNLCHFPLRLRREPFDGWEIALQPYWLILLSSIWLTMMCYGWNWLLVRTRAGQIVVRWIQTSSLCRCCAPPNASAAQLAQQDSDSSIQQRDGGGRGGGSRAVGIPRATSHARHGRARDKVDSVLRDHAAILSDALADGAVHFTLDAAPSFMALQLILQFGHFIYCICTLHWDQSGWRMYEELYCRVLNGGAAALILPVFYASVSASRAPPGSLPRGYAYALNLYFVMLLPILLTHGFLMYVFVHLLLVLLLVACVGFSPRVLSAAIRLLGPKVIMLVAVAANTVVAFLVQSAVISGVMFYSGTHYLRTMLNEYELRDTQCYAAVIGDQVQHMIASLVSLV